MIMELCRFLRQSNIEFDLQRQLRRSGTAVGALISESEYAQSKADFICKLSIALKEANETRYWIGLLTGTHSIHKQSVHDTELLLDEIIRMLTASIKTAKGLNQVK